MYILLTLFVISSTGIAIMLGRKWKLASNGQIVEKEHAHPFVPDIQKIKVLAIENTKKYAHLSIIAILRMHIRSSNFIKNKYAELKTKIKNRNGNLSETTEVSKFLKMISDYKNKIREIKHKIHEEENNP